MSDRPVNQNLTEITTPSLIRDYTFSKQRYQGFEVTFINENGYLNVTQLCDKYEAFTMCRSREDEMEIEMDVGEEGSYVWRKPRRSSGIPTELEALLQTEDIIPATFELTEDDMLVYVGSEKGIYIHPSIISHIISWIWFRYSHRALMSQYCHVTL